MRTGEGAGKREEPPNYSHAPPATPRRDATIKIVVMGDANGDWLAYGLEDAFSEKPEIGIVRKHRTESGLIRYDQHRDSELAAGCARDHRSRKAQVPHDDGRQQDRQAIREIVSTAGPSASPKVNGQQPTRDARRMAPSDLRVNL